jgi:hypothetical protein
MSEILITLAGFYGAITVSLFMILRGCNSYKVWEQEKLTEKEKTDRLRFGLTQDDVTVSVQGPMAQDYYRNHIVEYNHDSLKNHVADILGRLMRVSEIGVIFIGCIYTVDLFYLSFSKGMNGALLIWAMPLTFIVTYNFKLLFAKACNFLIGRMPMEPFYMRNPARGILEGLAVGTPVTRRPLHSPGGAVYSHPVPQSYLLSRKAGSTIKHSPGIPR